MTQGYVIKLKTRLRKEVVRSIRSALRLVPLGIGSGLEFQIFDRIAERDRERLEEFVYGLAEEIAEIAVMSSDRIRKEFFDTDEFRFILKGVLLLAAKEHRREKIAAFRSLLLNCMVEDPQLDFDRKVFFLETVDLLSSQCLKLLRYLYTQRESPDAGKVGVKRIWEEFKADDEAARNYLYSGLDTLANRVLIANDVIPMKIGVGKKPARRRAGSRAVYDFTSIDRGSQEFRITGLGMEFIGFVTSPALPARA